MARSGFEERFPERGSAAAKALARNVRRLRLNKEWTQDELGAALGVGQEAISHIENCRANPTLETLEALAASLGVKLTELFEARTAK